MAQEQVEASKCSARRLLNHLPTHDAIQDVAHHWSLDTNALLQVLAHHSYLQEQGPAGAGHWCTPGAAAAVLVTLLCFVFQTYVEGSFTDPCMVNQRTHVNFFHSPSCSLSAEC
jgi:hypothetical protein